MKPKLLTILSLGGLVLEGTIGIASLIVNTITAKKVADRQGAAAGKAIVEELEKRHNDKLSKEVVKEIAD